MAATHGRNHPKKRSSAAVRWLVSCPILFPVLLQPVFTQSDDRPYTFFTLAGAPPDIVGAGHWDAVGTDAAFFLPSGLAIDADDNLYVADYGNSAIRRISPDGTVSTLAGEPQWEGSRDGTGIRARFNNPRGLTVDSTGVVYVADTYNSMVRRIGPGGVVTSLAGMPDSTGLGTTDGTGRQARFNTPRDIAIAPDGTLFIADTNNAVIRRMSPDGVVTTFAGLAREIGYADGLGNQARFSQPSGIAVDSDGNLFIADSGNHSIRRITPDGLVTTPAGSPIGEYGDTDGTGSNARFQWPAAVAVGPEGNVYIADSDNCLIRRMSPDGVVTTVAGRSQVNGATDGYRTDALFFRPWGVVVDSQGNIFVGDTWNHTVRRISKDGRVSTVAGTPDSFANADGTGLEARFRTPAGIAIGPTGALFVADLHNQTIREISSIGEVTTFTGGSIFLGPDPDGITPHFGGPADLAFGPDGILYLADRFTHTISRITPDGKATILAGRSMTNYQVDGFGDSARFFSPEGIAVGPDGTIYVGDSGNNAIRRVTPDGHVTTLAGSHENMPPVYGRDGFGPAAGFNRPIGITVDKDGVLYVADTYGQLIRKITPEGMVSTVAGKSSVRAWKDGFGAEARFFNPWGITVDSDGVLFVADRENHMIRRITPDGNVTTIGGKFGRNAPQSGTADGTGDVARFNFPQAITVDADGRLFIADSFNNTIRVGIRLEVPPVITRQPEGQTVTEGESTVLSVQATNPGTLFYQWQLNGVDLPGEDRDTLILPSVQSFLGGIYTVKVTANAIPVMSEAVELSVLPAPPSDTRLLNLSTRNHVSRFKGILISGFVISGAGQRQLLIRGVGPGLGAPPFYLPGLQDPRIRIMQGQEQIAENDNWTSNSNLAEIISVSSTVGAFQLRETDKDSALLVDLKEGAYTIPMTGPSTPDGFALIEIYDASESGPSLTNISTRGFVGGQAGAMIPGFVLSGTGSRTLLIRAVGPTLGLDPFNLTEALSDPVLTVYSGDTALLRNDDWGTNADADRTRNVSKQIGAFPLAEGSRDAAFVVSLPAGVYTVNVSGGGGLFSFDGATGTALVEIYLVP